MTEKLITKDKFFGGIVRDDKSSMIGTVSNAEEVDIFTNADYVQAEQIFIADAIPTNTSIYSYTAGDDDTVYTYGGRTDATAGRVVINSVATGGAANPGSFAALFTSADTTNLASVVSDFKFFRTTEGSNPTSVYYIRGASTSWYLDRYNIGAAAEQTWGGSSWGAGTANASSKLTGLTGTNMRPTQKVIFGEQFICHGQFIAKVGSDATFTEKAFTLPKEWEAVDIIPVSDVALILARNKNVLVNKTRCFWWDLSSATQFDDSFDIPMGGPQWIYNYKETVTIFCAINGIGKFYVAPAYAGAKPQELPNIVLTNLGTETTTQPISSAKNVSEKDGILYFGLFKTDKSGVYALGQLDGSKPVALILSKRFHTSDYSLHKPYGLLIQGSNYYAAFLDNAAAALARCETLNSPTRSSNAVVETVWIDDSKPSQYKDLVRAFITSYPLGANTSLALSVASDFSSSYTSVVRADNTAFNTANGVLGFFRPAAFTNKLAFRAKVAFTSSTTTSAKLQTIGLRIRIKEVD